MTREHKLALIIGFSVFMIVGVLVGDYFSKARMARVDPALANSGGQAAQPVPAPVAPPTLPEELQTRVVNTTHRHGDVILDMDDVKPPLVDLDEIARNTPGADQAGTGTDGISRFAGPNPQPPIVVPSNDKTYKVEAKDTLIKLARKNYGDENLWQELRDYNKATLKGKDDLTVGMILKMPTKDVLLGRPAASPQAAPSGNRATPRDVATGSRSVPAAPRTYTVEKGDTLGNIAIKTLGTSKRIPEIAKLNPSIDPESLRVGAVLKLPAR